MATDFSNGVITSNGFLISKTNTPTRIGEIIESLSEIESIPNPVVNMKIWVKDEQCEYRVLTLKSKSIGGINIPNSVIDIYEKTDKESLNWTDVE